MKKQYFGDKYRPKGASVQSGLSDQKALDQGALRGEGQGQRPKGKNQAVSTDRGTFTCK